MTLGRPALTLVLATSLSGALSPVVAAASAPTSELRVGQAGDFTRLEFHGLQPLAARGHGRTVVFRFGGAGPTDLSRLHVAPPRWIEGAERVATRGGVEIRLRLAEGTTATLGRADGSAFLNVAGPPAAKSQAAPAQVPAQPSPTDPVVRMAASLQGRSLRLSFPWPEPVTAAVFRRGEAVWVVFGAPARLDLVEAPHGLAQLTRIEPVGVEHAAALRLAIPRGVRVGVVQEGATWSVVLGPEAEAAGDVVSLTRDSGGGLTAALAGGSPTVWLKDPVVGDRIAVVPARGPVKGLPQGARFIEADLLASLQGLALQPKADALSVVADNDTVRVSAQRGMALSRADAKASSAATPLTDEIDLPRAAPMPGLVMSEAWSRTGRAGFIARYDALRAAAAEEGASGQGGLSAARMGLARFLVGSDLAFEAIGALDLLAKAEPKVVDTAEFRGLRGAARAMAGRAKEAEQDLTAPAVSGDPACSLWRGWLMTRGGDAASARDAFVAGRAAIEGFSPLWQARFRRAEADAALASGDVEGARAALAAIPARQLPGDDAEALALGRAMLAEASGKPDEALALYATLEKSPYGAVSAPATLRLTQLRLAKHAEPLADALRALDGLRFRWRGDATEFAVLRAMGELYLSQGRYREALDALRSGGRKLSDAPASIALQAELDGAFRTLFLDGGADGLQPLQALALFDDFRELTPVGAEGDLIVRKLARRLVSVDLLNQAANLLQYQVDNRLDGAAKAEVAADLASVYLMAQKPEQAIAAIEGSRSTLLPSALNGERRRVEARALVALGRFDHALEVLGSDASAEAQAVRADAAWRRRDWRAAAAAAEASLGARWTEAARPLDADERSRLLRAGIAYSLAGDGPALTRLRERWGALAETDAGGSDALKLALAGSGGGELKAADLAKAGADTDAMAGWITRAKSNFLAEPTKTRARS